MAKGSSSYEVFNSLMADLDAKNLAPVYLLHGEEHHFLNQLLDKIEEVALDEATKSFNHHVFYGKDSNPLDIINTCKRFPMMADYQVVVVKEAQRLLKSELMIPYLEMAMPQTILVWFHPGAKLPMNRKLGMAFKKHTMFLADAIEEKQMAKVVETYVKEKGYDIEPKPLHLLIESSGNKYSVVVSELEKVFANVTPGNKIRLEEIQEYVGINKEYNIFELQKAIGKKNKAKALEMMDYFGNNLKNNPLIMMNSMLFSYFKKVAILQSMRGKTEKEMMSLIGIPWFAMAEYKEAASNYRGRKIEAVIGALNDCDLKFKGIKENAGDEKALFQETILKILSQ